MNNKLITNRNLVIINFIIISYFALLYLLYLLKIDFVIIGVFRELLTLPFMAAQIVFLAIGMYHLKKHKSNLLGKISILALAISAILTIGSFFF